MAALAVAPVRLRTWRQTYVGTYAKGKALSHLLGAVIASQFVISGAAGKHIPYVSLPFNTDWLDFPLRLIAVWLLLDRNWRIGRMKFSTWDALALGFPIIVGLLYPFSVADPTTGADVDGYKSFLGDMLRYYTVFVLVREGHLRAGFQSRTLVLWIVAGLSCSASLSLLQAANVHGVRAWSQRFFDQFRSLNPKDPYRARGTAKHWNGFASEMVLGFLLVSSPLNWRPLKWWEYVLASLMVCGLVVSTSRGGYATLMAVLLAGGIFFLGTGRKRTGAVVLAGLVSLALVFGCVVMTYKVKLFKELLTPPKVENRDLGSLAYRMERAKKLIAVGMAHPLSGTGPSEKLYWNEKTQFYSQSAVQGYLDVTYPLLFAQFGLVGLLYMALVILFFLSFIRKPLSSHPYAFLAFCTGVAFAVHSYSEVLMRSETMYLVSAVAGLACSRVLVDPRLRQVRTPQSAQSALGVRLG